MPRKENRMTATASFVPDLAFGLAERASDLFARGWKRELSAKELGNVISVCQVLKELLTSARESIETWLSQGVDPKAFAIKYEKTISDLDPLKEALERGIAITRAENPHESADKAVWHIQELQREVMSLQH